jgi:uncharacterized protein YndB with AHSA1/START domain
MAEQITVSVIVNADRKTAWNCYTLSQHIINWNFAHESWHCPHAENDMRIGGTYSARMEARDGSGGFDFKAIYTAIKNEESFEYGFDERTVKLAFSDVLGGTEVAIVFDAETENPIELQRDGWQAILDNYKNYTEAQAALA